MQKMVDWWSAIFFDASVEERLRMTRFLWRAGMTIFMIWSVGTFAGIGFHGFAKANEVDQKIKAAVDPINAQLEEIKAKELSSIKHKLEDSERIQKRILAAQISSQLRDLHRLKCSTGDAAVRMRMESDIDEAQREYIELTRERYPLPACKDL